MPALSSNSLVLLHQRQRGTSRDWIQRLKKHDAEREREATTAGLHIKSCIRKKGSSESKAKDTLSTHSSAT